MHMKIFNCTSTIDYRERPSIIYACILNYEILYKLCIMSKYYRDVRTVGADIIVFSKIKMIAF